MRILIDAGVLEQLDTKASIRVLGALLRALVTANLEYLKANPNTPHPYKAGIRYKREPKNTENWKGIAQIIRDGHGDCEDLAAYLVAYAQFHGDKTASIILRWVIRPTGRLFHVLTKLNGQHEDPSKKLGM